MLPVDYRLVAVPLFETRDPMLTPGAPFNVKSDAVELKLEMFSDMVTWILLESINFADDAVGGT